MIYDDKLNKRKKEKLEGETDRLKAQRNRKIDREDEGGEERKTQKRRFEKGRKKKGRQRVRIRKEEKQKQRVARRAYKLVIFIKLLKFQNS